MLVSSEVASHVAALFKHDGDVEELRDWLSDPFDGLGSSCPLQAYDCGKLKAYALQQHSKPMEEIADIHWQLRELKGANSDKSFYVAGRNSLEK